MQQAGRPFHMWVRCEEEGRNSVERTLCLKDGQDGGDGEKSSNGGGAQGHPANSSTCEEVAELAIKYPLQEKVGGIIDGSEKF